ncbi:hypothetical protein niasHS_010903 [Heterodera schachtii]|uniref:Uncharacterized protein n=1 Tax=Heterodera schachtii TaxID=97005 RepID=A0ABD2IV25_HETSC
MHNGKNNSGHKNKAVISKSLVNINNNPRRCPKYAIVRLTEGTNVLQFYQLLLDNGHEEVSFVNEMRENAFQLYEKPNNDTGKDEASIAADTGKKKLPDAEQKQTTDTKERKSPIMVDKGVQVIPERTIFASPSFSSSFRTQLPASPILRTAKKEQTSSLVLPLRDASNHEKLSFD